jgi:hypothetical protein
MARAGTRTLWEKRIAKWKQSGLGARDFAEREGLQPKTLWWWGRHLRLAKAPAVAKKPAFVEVVARASNAEQHEPFEVVLQGETRVVVPASFESDGLRRLLSVLRGV